MDKKMETRKFEAWRHGLLDTSKRNRLMSYRKTKRATLQITTPSMDELYRRLVTDGETLTFRRQIDPGDDLHLSQLFYIMDKMDASVELAEGEVRSDLSTAEMNRTLKNLRSKATLSLEEQGINILYLSFGFLSWRQKPKDEPLLSPLVLVPISLDAESFLSPYTMKRLDEDIVINPTLEYALASDFDIELPAFDVQNESLSAYLDKVGALVSSAGWSIQKEANIGLLSFLKIMMYTDLEKNRERIFANPVVQAFCGNVANLPPISEDLHLYNHDLAPAIDSCQVVNADASQQDAILLSRKGNSFVLQGPPGTGKSQTITNIISQALADHKKVLFVSEKMAALSVVYRRLSDAGLADYCLSLHNYKAERRAVLQDLLNTLDAPTRSVKPGAADALCALDEERAALNAYIEEMEKVRQPLSASIFEVLTEVVRTETEHTYHPQTDVLSLTDAQLRSRTLSLRKLSDFFQENGSAIYENPWRDTGISIVTYELRNTLSQRLGDLSASLFGLVSIVDYLNKTYNLSVAWTEQDFSEIVASLIKSLLAASLAKQLERPDGRCLLTGKDSAQLERLSTRLNTGLEKARLLDIETTAAAPPATMEEALASYAETEKHLQHCKSILSKANAAFPVELSEDAAGLQEALSLVHAANVPHPVPSAWLGEGRYASVLAKTQLWKRLSEKANALRKELDSSWEPAFYNLDAEELLRRFRTEYTSFFKRLGAMYRQDKAQLAALHKAYTKKLPDDECMAALEKLLAYRAALLDFKTASADAPLLLGPLFQGLETDWQYVLRVLDDCSPANDYTANYEFTDNFLAYLQLPHEERARHFAASANGATFEGLLAEITEEIAFSESHAGQFATLPEAERKTLGLAPGYTAQLALLKERVACLQEQKDAYVEGTALLADYAIPLPEKTAASLTDTLQKLWEMAAGLKKTSSEANGYFAKLGIPKEAVPSLGELFEEYYVRKDVPREADALASLVPVREAESFLARLTSAPEKIRLPFEQEALLAEFFSWFPLEDRAATPLADLLSHVNCCRNVEELQLWLQYHSLIVACEEQGLEDYLAFIEKEGLQAEEIVPVYRKSVLSKWLIDLLVTTPIPNLLNFHSYAHEKTIQSFSEDDGRQLEIAKARLLEQLSHEKPDGLNRLARAMDEVSLLRREAEKKRRIIPLRLLFKTIPTLLQKLKPCFMMSPLSVSYFLDSELYSFDLVIFDEASQILPEDAIGAIYRGKQAIIAGDSRQMPPTSFFSVAARNTDDAEIDEDSDEYYPEIVSESVLDEANACLPSCTLLWHYRSKDESLIAFSNQQLYNGKLITFPNPARLPDRGLEYVYVPDGYYEGSGKNCNIPEAQKCLSLVLAHIEKHPERSLGIIAFSEKQQTIIEDVINEYRMQNPQFEDFFAASREEPFFVKNLENVQGDERDTIIFSICYAKNVQGRMYQRFGPLGHEGGERRLNVAITRAKYNVKLVGSILPTDIAVKEGTKEGVRLLRDYITYAMQGSSSGIASGNKAAEEPFADYIASFLEKEGFACSRNVGMSQYKVDIAVRAKDKPDTFLAGIECDGQNYSNTRTARDRDVLRRSVMASLGWSLYHTWSMAWFLNPEEEKKRLLGFLAKCVSPQEAEVANASAALRSLSKRSDSFSLTEEPALRFSSERSAADFVPLFPGYQQADPWKAPCSPTEDIYATLAKRILYVVKCEHPIHVEELYRRLSPVFGRQKITAPIRRAIDDCIQGQLKRKVELRDDFLYLSGADIQAKSPQPGEEPRVIEHISPEEIQDAMCQILSLALGLPPKALLGETARQLGYARTGPKINEILAENYKALLAAGKIKETDGKAGLANL